MTTDQKYYIFLDEVQNVLEFPRIIDSLFIDKNIDLYVTGSNAFMLSTELATLLSGRYIELHILPLSFREFVGYYKFENNLDLAYQKYISNSSFPFTIELNEDSKSIKEYIKSVYNTVILKDVMTRKKISNPLILESLVLFLLDNIGNIVSTNKISDSLTSYGRKTDVKTIEKYIDSLCESFILYKIKRYDVKGKRCLKTLEKYYLVDLGLRYNILSKASPDYGRELENFVFLELKQRGYEVSVGKADDYEIDFIVEKTDGVEYFQVVATTREKKVIDRELRSLKTIPDSYPKTILTLDREPVRDYEGIKVINALDWANED